MAPCAAPVLAANRGAGARVREMTATHASMLRSGDPEAWDSPLTPLVLLEAPGDPAVLAGAQRCAERLIAAPHQEASEAVRPVLAAWWRNETDAREMLRYLGRLAVAAGDGSREHRRAVLLACLCARTAPCLPTESARALDLVEAWAWGGQDRRRVAHKIASDAHDAHAAAAPAVALACRAARAARVAAHAAAHAAYVATNAAYVAAAVSAAAHATHAAIEGRLADLADLIRAALPEP